jgi:ankyrin repeat protein
MAAEAAVEAIHRAVYEGDIDAVARMLDEDPQLLTTMWENRPLLTWAAFNGHVGLVELLLERGADANSTTSRGTTALHFAALWGHEEVVSLLLSSGADVYRRNTSGWTALMYASRRGHVAVVRLLLRSMEGRGLDERSTDGCTALFWACYNGHGHADVVRALLLAGADHTIPENNGWTPQQIAQERHHPECTALIQVSTPIDIHEQLLHHGAAYGYG